METDIGEIRKTLEAWSRELPGDAHATLERCAQLSRKIAALRGAYAPDPQHVRDIQTAFASLEQDMPVLKTLFTSVQKARAGIKEFRDDPTQHAALRNAVREFSEEHLALLDHILRVVGDRSQAYPAISQVEQIRAWARQRREAGRLVRQVSQLKDEVGPSRNAVLADVERNWTELVQQGNIDEDWLEQAQSQLNALRAEFPPPARPAPPPAPAAPAPNTTVSLLPLNDISAILAECRDLARALRLGDLEIDEFERRQQELYDHPSEASIQQLLDAVRAFHDGLRAKALQVKEERLRALGHRWASFQLIYRDMAGGQVRQLVDEAQAATPETTHGLMEFLDRIDEAMAMIDNTVASDRRPLTSAIQNAAQACRLQIDEMRSQPRTLAVEEGLKKQELRLPDSGRAAGTVPQSFEWLECCQNVLAQLQALREQNNRSQTELSARAAQLLKVARSVASAADAAESAAAEALIRDLSEQEASSVWLDARTISLARAETALDALMRKVRERLTLNLVALRKQNRAWIRPLAEFDPQVTAFEAKDTPSADLDELRAATAREIESRNRIADFASAAAVQLKKRIDALSVQIEERLAKPSFETHPERDRAVASLENLRSIPPLQASPGLDEFVDACETAADVEYFLDRLDADRRELPVQVQALRERVRRLNELNAATYRPIMAQRVKALVQGMDRAIRTEQFEPLKFQLERTRALIQALEADVELRVSAETEDLEQRVKAAIKTSTNPRFRAQAESALEQLAAEGHLETPSDRIRKTLARLLSRGGANMGANA